MRAQVLACLIALAVASFAHAAPEVRALLPGQASPPARIADMAWLEGRWVGEGLGGQAEESYAAPVEGAMMGMFRSVRSGKVAFYEFVVLAERQGSLVYRLKHYWPDGRAWEEKDQWMEFPLVALTPDRAFFDGCTFERDGPDAMKVHVRIGDRATGQTRIETFTYRRAR